MCVIRQERGPKRDPGRDVARFEERFGNVGWAMPWETMVGYQVSDQVSIQFVSFVCLDDFLHLCLTIHIYS